MGRMHEHERLEASLGWKSSKQPITREKRGPSELTAWILLSDAVRNMRPILARGPYRVQHLGEEIDYAVQTSVGKDGAKRLERIYAERLRGTVAVHI